MNHIKKKKRATSTNKWGEGEAYKDLELRSSKENVLLWKESF